jgi:preprotein translocase subunit YajC
MIAATGIGPGGWILIVLILAWFTYMIVRRVRAQRSDDEDE